MSIASKPCGKRSPRRGRNIASRSMPSLYFRIICTRVWTLPPDDADFSIRWRLIKARFAKGLPKQEWLSAVRKKRGERGIWQRRFWEHLIRDEADYARHVEYCYINPVKHGLVTCVGDWPYSTFHRDVHGRIFPEDWAGDISANGEFGEAL